MCCIYKEYQKKGTIHKGNSQLSVAVILGIFVTAMIGFISWKIQGVSYVYYMNEDKVWEVLALLPSLFIVFVIHELIHIGLFHLFGKGKAKVIPKREKELGAVIMHQVNPEVFYTRNQMLIILLSPLILLTVLLLVFQIYLPLPFLLLMNIILNSLGSSTDIYASYLLLTKYSRNDMINFEPDEHIMNIYERKELKK